MALVLANELCAFEIDPDTGVLIAVRDLARKTRHLSCEKTAAVPFLILADFSPGGSDLDLRADTRIGPADMRVRSAQVRLTGWRQLLRILYEIDGLRVALSARLRDSSAQSHWDLELTNTGETARTVAVEFPRFEGVPAWKAADMREGVMQWQAAVDPATGSGFGAILEETAARRSRFFSADFMFGVRPQAPVTLAPGISLALPAVSLVVSGPGWRPTARAYAGWRGSRGRRAALPPWYREGAFPIAEALTVRSMDELRSSRAAADGVHGRGGRALLVPAVPAHGVLADRVPADGVLTDRVPVDGVPAADAPARLPVNDVARLAHDIHADGICISPSALGSDPRELLAAMRAFRAAAPDCLLLAAAAPGGNPLMFDGIVVRQDDASVDFLLRMRVSFPRFRPWLLGSSHVALAASLAGVAWALSPSGRDRDLVQETAWACASVSARRALLWGRVMDDPVASDPQACVRLFEGKGATAIVAARLAEPPSDESVLADLHLPWEIHVPVGGARIPEIAVCDLEDISWHRHVAIVRDGVCRVDTSSNWVLCLVLGRGVHLFGFDPLPEVAPGGELSIRPSLIAGSWRTRRIRRIRVEAPFMSPRDCAVGEELRIRVPADVAPGFYPVSLSGRHLLPFARFLRVLG